MDQGNSSLRDRLLARLPQPENLAAYREEVAAGLEKNEKAFRRERWATVALWIFAVGLSTAFLCLGMRQIDTPKSLWLGILACFVLLYPLGELLKHFINRSRVEILKEVKQVQLQLLELQASLLNTRGK
jgi:hypothetical protein